MSTLAAIRRRGLRRTRPVLLLTVERELQDLTQARLSAKALICTTYISGIESGRLNPTREQLDRLSRALDVYPPEALLQPVSVTVSV